MDDPDDVLYTKAAEYILEHANMKQAYLIASDVRVLVTYRNMAHN
jgi:hypothetical protein